MENVRNALRSLGRACACPLLLPPPTGSAGRRALTEGTETALDTCQLCGLLGKWLLSPSLDFFTCREDSDAWSQARMQRAHYGCSFRGSVHTPRVEAEKLVSHPR